MAKRKTGRNIMEKYSQSCMSNVYVQYILKQTNMEIFMYKTT